MYAVFIILQGIFAKKNDSFDLLGADGSIMTQLSEQRLK